MSIYILHIHIFVSFYIIFFTHTNTQLESIYIPFIIVLLLIYIYIYKTTPLLAIIYIFYIYTYKYTIFLDHTRGSNKESLSKTILEEPTVGLTNLWYLLLLLFGFFSNIISRFIRWLSWDLYDDYSNGLLNDILLRESIMGLMNTYS